MFDTLKTMREKNENRNMYEIVYSGGKKLKDDKRLTYYSFLKVISYPDVILLCLFSILYMTASGLNVELAHPLVEYEIKWPF